MIRDPWTPRATDDAFTAFLRTVDPDTARLERAAHMTEIELRMLGRVR